MGSAYGSAPVSAAGRCASDQPCVATLVRSGRPLGPALYAPPVDPPLDAPPPQDANSPNGLVELPLNGIVAAAFLSEPQSLTNIRAIESLTRELLFRNAAHSKWSPICVCDKETKSSSEK